ncbi:BTAD domain-containing putative transcriptional regulator [Amycolatopsis sp. NPDC088138]|uniref:AfsR/SARP family transcriptional regulator n=1 Tax=Amycolatopsis sp. NPDC088138 TaxID=3363938 RepID=UPI00382B3290
MTSTQGEASTIHPAEFDCPWPGLLQDCESAVPPLAVDVLGPLTVRVRGRTVTLTAGRLRALLAGLAMSAGRTVPLQRLTEIVWGDHLPVDPRRSLQTYVSRLRSALGARFIETHPAGLRLDIAPDDVDALRFLRRLETAAADTDREESQLDGALSLWRGEPFEGVNSRWLGQSERPRLLEAYLCARERRIDLRILEGAHGSLTAELEVLTARYPLRESLWVRHLVVLDRCGRRAEAVRRYEVIRRRLVEELGTDPSPELQRVYSALL